MTDRRTDDWVYLRTSLEPLAPALARADVTDIYVNRAGEIWIESLGGTIERQDCPRLDEQSLWRLARQVAAWNHQGISREHPLLSASLPDGARIQIVAPPATRGPIAIAIRKHVSASLSLEDYAVQGGFATTKVSSNDKGVEPLAPVAAALEANNITEALRLAVTSRQNILISGGTSTGKTTFLNALLREVSRSERLVTIEDTPELQIEHQNAVGLIAVRGALGEAQVSANDLVTASLRLRPDRIILGELRGSEAFAFLRAVNTGHPGSMTTIHADSPRGAIEQLTLLVLQNDTKLSRSDVQEYVRSTIGVFVQLARRSGRRVVSDVRLQSGLLA